MKIRVKITERYLVIEIPKDTLIFAAENNPDLPIKIIDRSAFVSEMARELEDGLGLNESGYTGLEELLDKGISELFESGSDSMEYKPVKP